jgi:drug/metabolite transporter (DMT)-like permease
MYGGWTIKRRRAIAAVLCSAVLFGVSTPLARALIGTIEPLWLAGLLYAGSGIGLALVLLVRRLRRQGTEPAVAPLAPGDGPWLAATILAGGVIAPVLFTFGLRGVAGATASLLLTLETVVTVAIAGFVFDEHRNERTVDGMVLIVAGCVLLGAAPGVGTGFGWGAPLIAAACLGWSIDNNLTRRISGNDAMLVAAAKGLVGGTVNVSLALALSGGIPAPAALLASGIVGFLGYGVSLTLFIVALRELGVARASAYYGVAPFFGAFVALPLLGERPGAAFWAALPLMAIGVWLHLTERHAHEHAHEALAHAHAHRHDEHHRHTHDFDWDGTEPHAHPHVHEPLVHVHSHAPDLHHRHRH